MTGWGHILLVNTGEVIFASDGTFEKINELKRRVVNPSHSLRLSPEVFWGFIYSIRSKTDQWKIIEQPFFNKERPDPKGMRAQSEPAFRKKKKASEDCIIGPKHFKR